MVSENAKLGRPSKYTEDMVYVPGYIPKKIKKMAIDLQADRKLATFNEAYNILLMSVDPKLAEGIADQWFLAKEMIEKHKVDLQDLKDVLNPISLIGKLEAGKEMGALIEEFLTVKKVREKLSNELSEWRYPKSAIASDKKRELTKIEKELAIKAKASKLIKDFNYWLAEKGKIVKKPRAVELLIYQKLKSSIGNEGGVPQEVKVTED